MNPVPKIHGSCNNSGNKCVQLGVSVLMTDVGVSVLVTDVGVVQLSGLVSASVSALVVVSVIDWC